MGDQRGPLAAHQHADDVEAQLAGVLVVRGEPALRQGPQPPLLDVPDRLDGVAEAAVIGVPDDRLGEVGKAYVVAKPGHDVGLPDVHQVMENAGVAKFKFPEKLIIVDAITTTKVGKIDKKELRLDVARRLADEHQKSAADAVGA